MKNFFLALLIANTLLLAAERTITVDTATLAMSKGVYPSYKVLIPQANLKEIEKSWLKYITAVSKGKAVTTNDETAMKGAINASLFPSLFNVYSKLQETGDGIQLTVWLTENDTVFISQAIDPTKDIAAQKYVRDFAIAEYREVVKNQLKDEQKKQKDLEEEAEDITKQQEKAGKKISDDQRSIQRSNDKIANNNAEIQSLEYKISDAEKMVAKTVSDENANKGAKKTLKDLESSKKQLKKDNENESKDIDNANKDIREKEREIADLKQQYETKLADIAKQKQKVQEVETHLANIN